MEIINRKKVIVLWKSSEIRIKISEFKTNME